MNVDQLTRIIWNEYIAIPRNKNGQKDKLSPANLRKLIEQWTEKNNLEYTGNEEKTAVKGNIN